MSKGLIVCAILLICLATQGEAQMVTQGSCRDGYFFDGQKCEQCATGCRKCSSPLGCDECLDGRYLDGKMCWSCGKDGVKNCCRVGNDSTAVRATACYEGYMLEGSVCIKLDTRCTGWIAGTYICNKCQDGSYLDEYNVCVVGTIGGCKTYVNKDNCGVCTDGYYLFKKTDGSNVQFMGCEKCDDNCKCSDEKNKCTACLDGAVYESSASGATPKVCSLCPNKSGENIVASLKCDAKGCLTNGTGCPSNALCLADGSDHICRTLPNCIKVAKDNDGLKCEVCKTGYYVKERNCEVCTSPTSTVEAEYTKCKSDTEFFQCQQTVWEIPFKDQKYLVPKADETSKTICTPNENNCKQMKDSKKECLECYEGWHVINGVCKSCAVEIPNCTKCSVSGSGETAKLLCESCRDNVDDANIKNYYPKADKTSCLEYPSQVLVCSTKNDDQSKLSGCTCASNYKVKNGTENECQKCDDSKCKSCGDKSVAGTNKCLNCFAGYGVIEDKCEPCSYNCSKCDKNALVCTQCNSGFFLVDNKYCSPKRDRCTAYDANGTCSTCEYNYFLNNGHCTRCNDLTIVTTAAAGRNAGAYERVMTAPKCPKVDAQTCAAISPGPDSQSGTGSNTTSNASILGSIVSLAAFFLAFFAF